MKNNGLSLRFFYFRDELWLMLERAGFASVRVEAPGDTGAEPTPPDDEFLVFIASGRGPAGAAAITKC